MPYPPRKTPSLSAPRARVVRARKYAVELQAELAPGARPDLYQASVIPMEQKDTYTISVRVASDLEIRWGLIVSDALHNLRSALDESLCQLIRLTTPRDNCRNRQFPIELKPDDITQKLRKIPPEAAELITRLQPYHAGNEDQARRTLLRVLHDLNIWDKHRFLSIITRNVAYPYQGFIIEGQSINGIASLTLDGYNQEVIDESDGWTLFRSIFKAPAGVKMGEPYMYLGWGWHWSGNPHLVDQTLLMLADEVERVLNLLEPIFISGVGHMRAKWNDLGNPEMTINEWLASLETPLE